MKTFWKYFLIVLLLILGLAMVGVLFLFFVPGSQLFNITYLSLNAQGVSNAYSKDDVQQITIENRDYPIRIVQANSDNISIKVYSNSLGFALVKNSSISFGSKIEDGKLTFIVNEPYGLVSKGNSFIELRVPENYSVDLKIVNRNATVNINKSDLTINNLFYKANIGELNYNSGHILGYLDLELNRSEFNLGKDVITNTNAVNLNVKDGVFNAPNSILGDINIESNTRGVFRIGECAKLTNRIDTAGGRFEIGTASTVDVRTSDTNMYISTLTNGGTIELTKAGKIEINETIALTDLKTNTGDITVNHARERVYLKSMDGHIAVNNAYYIVNAQSDYGDIIINFNSDADHFSNTGARALEASTNKGKIVASGVENINLNINNKGVAEIQMNDVLGISSVNGKAGNINLKINNLSKYILTTKSETGNVSVDLMQFDVTLGNVGYTTREETTTRVNCENISCTNSLVVTTTSGDLKIRDMEI